MSDDEGLGGGELSLLEPNEGLLPDGRTKPLWLDGKRYEGGVCDYVQDSIENFMLVQELSGTGYKYDDVTIVAPEGGDYRRCPICTLPKHSCRCAPPPERKPSIQGNASQYEPGGSDSDDEGPLMTRKPRPAGFTLTCRLAKTQGSDWADTEVPTPRGGHSSVFLAADKRHSWETDKLITFGGFDYDDGELFQGYKTVVHTHAVLGGVQGGNTKYFGELHWLCLETSTWHRPDAVAGEAPAARAFHTATIARVRARDGRAAGRTLMFVFGGRGGGGRSFNDLSFLDVTDMRRLSWHQVATSVQPSLRYQHSAVLLGETNGKLLVFGGRAANGTATNDLWALDCAYAAQTEAEPVLAQLQAGGLWTQPHVAGVPPSPRFGHQMSLLPEGGRLYVLGGGEPVGQDYTPTNQVQRDVKAMPGRMEAWELDTVNFIWSKPRLPSFNGHFPRGGLHFTLSTGGRFLLCFGGAEPRVVEAGGQLMPVARGYIHLLDLGNLRWAEPVMADGIVPDARYGHSANVIGSRVVTFGGWDDQGAVNDLLVFEMPRQ
jgi:hypothetical protein